MWKAGVTLLELLDTLENMVYCYRNSKKLIFSTFPSNKVRFPYIITIAFYCMRHNLFDIILQFRLFKKWLCHYVFWNVRKIFNGIKCCSGTFLYMYNASNLWIKPFSVSQTQSAPMCYFITKLFRVKFRHPSLATCLQIADLVGFLIEHMQPIVHLAGVKRW